MPKLAFFLTEGFLTIASLAVLFGYHLALYRQIRRNPATTAIGLSAMARLAWVSSVMEEGRELSRFHGRAHHRWAVEPCVHGRQAS